MKQTRSLSEHTRLYPMSGWSILYIKGSQSVLPPFSEDRFVLANSGDLGEMTHFAAFRQGLHCLTRVSSLHRVK